MSYRKSTAITWLRCIASFLIVNSHLRNFYPENLKLFGTGGSFGNALFFFTSGYCLYYCFQTNFLSWMKKRIIRIYTPYLLFSLVLIILKPSVYSGIKELLFPIQNYHFIPTIITLYPIYYLFSKVGQKYNVSFFYLFLFTFVVQLLYFFTFYDFSYWVHDRYKILPMMSFFQAMLLGGYFFEKKPTIPKVCLWVGLLLSFVIWHFRPSSGPFGIIRLYDGTLFVSSLGGLLLAYEENLPKFKVVEIISGITLEIYLVNEFIIRKLSNLAFPVNMICAFCLILLSALCINYFTKIMTKYSKRLMEWLSRKTS